MAVKAINNLARLNGIILIFLVFGAYPQITKIDALSLSVIKRAKAIYVTTKEVCRLQAKRQVKDVLAIKNGPNTTFTLSLPILLKVRIWRKKNGQNRLYKLLAINGEIYIINMPYRPTNF